MKVKCKHKICPDDCQADKSNCEIITPRRKMVRVKAWAYVNNYGEIETIATTKVIGRKPCTITIAEKYLKGRK